MGARPRILLVRRLVGFLAALALASCASQPRGAVDPEDYDSFFLWAGVAPPAVLDRAETVYLLAGEVRAGDASSIVPMRPGLPKVDHAGLWMVIRVERIDWTDETYAQLMRGLARWDLNGNRMEGVQVDFDAATQGLSEYASFLAELRKRLPPQFKLSITGLMDWSANGDPAALAELAGVVDEIVIQTYQGRTTIPGYEGYMDGLARLDMPYRIALVEGGKWSEPASVASDQDFLGYVVFLLPGRQREELPQS
jgi:hypothetical protein